MKIMLLSVTTGSAPSSNLSAADIIGNRASKIVGNAQLMIVTSGNVEMRKVAYDNTVLLTKAKTPLCLTQLIVPLC